MRFKAYASSSAGNLYSVEAADGTRLLLECGLPLRQIQAHLGHTLSGVAGVLATHSHKDHSWAAKDLLRRGVPVYCSAGTALELGLSGFRVMRAGAQVQIGGVAVMALEAQHDAPEPLAYVLDDGQDRLLFATDTAYLGWRMAGLTMVAVEANYAVDLLPDDMHPAQRRRLVHSHMGLGDALELLGSTDLSRVREIHLLHLSASHSDAERFQAAVAGATGIPTYVAPE